MRTGCDLVNGPGWEGGRGDLVTGLSSSHNQVSLYTERESAPPGPPRCPVGRGQVSTRIDPGGEPSPTLHSANRIFLAARPRTADLSGSSTAHRSAAHHASSRATATEQANHRSMPPECGAALHNAARAAALRVWASASGAFIIADHSSSAMSTEISRSESINTPVHFPFGPPTA